ncbi:MAG: response regulator [Myxococcales bacterium]|nr:response regulator [Myxococcales bacterium]
MHVLIVEDIRQERELMARHLVAAGHDVTQAADAKAALQTFAERPPEVLLTDWGLVGPSGLELIKRVRSMATPHYVYSIVVTGRTNPADIAQVYGAGADDFLRKPVFKEELIARVEAPKRIAQWASRLAASATVHDFTGRYDATRLRAWREVETVVTADISDMLGQMLVVDRGAVSPVVMSAGDPAVLAGGAARDPARRGVRQGDPDEARRAPARRRERSRREHGRRGAGDREHLGRCLQAGSALGGHHAHDRPAHQQLAESGLARR